MADSPVVTYEYWSPNQNGAGQNPNIGVLHDVESPLAPGYAKSLIGPAWFGSTKAGTSTHYIVDPIDICQGVRESVQAWHCGTGNRGSIGVEQAGYARFNRDEWTTSDGLKQRHNVARLMADINSRRPLIRLKWLSDSELRSAFNNPGSPGGWATHNQMSRVIGGTNHYDPMNSAGSDQAYPLSELMNEAVAIRNGSTTPVEDDDMPLSTEDINKIVEALVNHELQPGRPLWSVMIQTDNNTQPGVRPDVLGGQTRDEALANTKNDVFAIKSALVDNAAPKD